MTDILLALIYIVAGGFAGLAAALLVIRLLMGPIR